MSKAYHGSRITYHMVGLLLAAAAAVAVEPSTGVVNLGWVNPNPSNSVDAFCLYGSTNLTLPLTNWTKLATQTNGNATNLVLRVTPAQYWFFLTCSNGWGESPPSNTAGPTPRSLSQVTGLIISVFFGTNDTAQQ